MITALIVLAIYIVGFFIAVTVDAYGNITTVDALAGIVFATAWPITLPVTLLFVAHKSVVKLGVYLRDRK